MTAHDEALRRIAKARITRQTTLDLGDLKLDVLPDELGDLSDLQVLSLGKISISSQNGELRTTYDSYRLEQGFRDLDALAPLTNLQSLYLTRCVELNDLRGLESLISLRTLDLNSCTAITDLRPLACLAGLHTLDLSGSALKTDARTLELFSNLDMKITDLSPLASLTNLWKLDLGGRGQIKDLSPLARLTTLRTLNLENCHCIRDDDLRALTSLSNLRMLTLRNNSISDLGVLESLTNLEALDVSRCPQIDDLDPLARLITLHSLDLSQCYHVTDIGPLTNLSNLEWLDLSLCQEITDLRPLASLTTLRALDLHGCKSLTDISSLAYLNKLECLDLGECPGIRDLSPLAQLAELQTLTLRNCEGITDLTALASLPNLELLSLADTWIVDLAPLTELAKLHTLYLNGCRRIADLNPLESLTKLNTLIIDDCEAIADLGALASLDTLHSLSLERCHQIVDLDPLASLSDLETLRLDDCGSITNLGALASLGKLQTLSLKGCHQITDLNPLAYLDKLETLDLDGCKSITNLDALVSLGQLHTLTISRCDGTIDLGALASLRKLRGLHITQCKGITNLEALAWLTELNELSLGGSEGITELDALASLRNLHTLDLRGCHRISDLNSLASLPNLQFLYLTDCSGIRRFAPLRGVLSQLAHLSIVNCRFEDLDPAFCGEYSLNNAVEAVRAHYADLAYGASDAVELKVLVLGNGGVGKTQLCNRICGRPFDSNLASTHGIRFDHTDVHTSGRTAPVRLTFWDFGGQDIYHGSHALFLQSNAIFLLVWTPETEYGVYKEGNGDRQLTFRNRPLSYWLEYVRISAGTNNPVLVVQGKCDHVDDNMPLPEAIPEEFTSLRCLNFSAYHDDKISSLRAALQQSAQELLDNQPNPPIGNGRARLRERLRNMLKQDQKRATPRFRTLTLSTFHELCEKTGQISNHEEMLRFLHQSGVLFWQPNVFQNQIILDQSWVLDAIYAIFHRARALPSLFGKGRFTREGLAALVWQGRSIAEQEVFLRIMVSCGICFRCRRINKRKYPEDWEYIAPELLPVRYSPEIQRELEGGRIPEIASAHATVRYRFLHEGVLRRFLSRIGSLASDATVYWKFGCWLYHSATNVSVLIDSQSWDKMGDPWRDVVTFDGYGDKSIQLLELLVAELTSLSIIEQPNVTITNASNRSCEKSGVIDQPKQGSYLMLARELSVYSLSPILRQKVTAILDEPSGLIWLRTLSVVRRTGSYNKTAQYLGETVQGVQAKITRLRCVGPSVMLVTADNKGVGLTDLGHELCDWAERILALIDGGTMKHADIEAH